MNRARMLILTLTLLFAFGAGRALAYVTTAPYTLIGGVKNRTYHINDSSNQWAADIRNGVASWNSSATPADFTESSSSAQTIDFDVTNWGTVDWCGYTFYLDGSGNYINYGGYPDKNWARSQVKIQQPPVSGCPALSKQATAAHEMGHAMGLKHSNISGVLMSVPTGAQTPQQDDIDGINSLY